MNSSNKDYHVEMFVIFGLQAENVTSLDVIDLIYNHQMKMDGFGVDQELKLVCVQKSEIKINFFSWTKIPRNRYSGPTSQRNTGDWSFTGGYGQAQPDNREAAQGMKKQKNRNFSFVYFCHFDWLIFHFFTVHFQNR